MDKWKKRFYDAHVRARNKSGCMKVAVGAVYVPEIYAKKSVYEGIFASNSNPEGYSCKDHNECYKAKVTGIYESCEETRPYCKSTHAEINLIEKMKKEYPEKDQLELLSDGTVWVTRYTCYNCALMMIKHGLKRLCFCGKQDISEDVRELLESAGVQYWHYPQWDFEGEHKEYPWWTGKFYDSAYEIVKDRKAPLTIISYNRPDVPSLQALGYHIPHIQKWPCLIFVRESQKDMYEESIGHYEDVTVVPLPDELVWNAGATRRESQKWLYNNGYTMAFQIDDDIESLGHGILDYAKDGWEKSGYYLGDVGRILAMWQIATERVIGGTGGKVMITGGMPVAFSWKREYCNEDWSACLSFGAMTQLVCWNVKGMVENQLFYRDNPDVGLDDIDMTLNVIERGFLVCGFPWLVYGCEPMGRPEQYIDGDFKKPGPDLIKRFQFNQDKLLENHGHLSFVVAREKRRLPQICINQLRLRKWQVEQGYLPSTDNRYDIWEDGDLLRQAKENSYVRFKGF